MAVEKWGQAVDNKMRIEVEVTAEDNGGSYRRYSGVEMFPSALLRELQIRISEELGARQAIVDQHPTPEIAKVMLSRTAARVKADMRTVRDLQRVVFVLTDKWPDVDPYP